MKKSAYWLLTMVSVVGGVVGYGGARLQAERANYAQLNVELGQLSNVLASGQNDLRQVYAKNNPDWSAADKRYNAKLRQGYQAEYTASIGQAAVLWDTVYSQLIQHGFSYEDVQVVQSGLWIIYQNIFMSIDPVPPATKQRAEAWVTLLAHSLPALPTNSQTNPDFVKMLKSGIGAVVQKYLSYKSDNEFQTSSLLGSSTSAQGSQTQTDFLQQRHQ